MRRSSQTVKRSFGATPERWVQFSACESTSTRLSVSLMPEKKLLVLARHDRDAFAAMEARTAAVLCIAIGWQKASRVL